MLKHSLLDINLERFKHMTKFMHFCIVTLNEWDNLLCAKLYLDLSLYNFVAFYTALIILCIKIFQF